MCVCSGENIVYSTAFTYYHSIQADSGLGLPITEGRILRPEVLINLDSQIDGQSWGEIKITGTSATLSLANNDI